MSHNIIISLKFTTNDKLRAHDKMYELGITRQTKSAKIPNWFDMWSLEPI